MSAPTFGVDEAGKGPVLGSMFSAAVVAIPAA
ncbi:MAG: ribonuclease HII, partial [Natrialbaceae archaeon]